MNAPGFVASLSPGVDIAIGMSRVYTLSWLVGTGVSCAVYVGLCYISPPPGMNRRFFEIDESASEVRFGADSPVEEHSEKVDEFEEGPHGAKAKPTGNVHVLSAE